MVNLIKASNTNKAKVFMNVNVILSFETFNSNGETQEFFDLALPVSKSEFDAITFINNKLFKRIVKKCELLNRRVEDLIKISTASNWSIFEQITNLPALCDLRHDCKWFFGMGRKDLSVWEKDLMSKYGFGIDADMSRIGDPVLSQQYMDNFIKRAIQNSSVGA